MSSEHAAGGPRAERAEVGTDGQDGATASWRGRRWTTIVLEERGDGWRATQTGVAAVGYGATAADAAAAYCRRIAETGEDAAERSSDAVRSPEGRDG